MSDIYPDLFKIICHPAGRNIYIHFMITPGLYDM
jgi:hypothetical protein